jgi:hypothetical protein
MLSGWLDPDDRLAYGPLNLTMTQYAARSRLNLVAVLPHALAAITLLAFACCGLGRAAARGRRHKVCSGYFAMILYLLRNSGGASIFRRR